MKRQSHIIDNEMGFYLPFVLFITAIIFSAITTAVIIYKNEIQLTQNMIEQLEVETLIQMGRANFVKEMQYKKQDNGKITYEFPSGVVVIAYEKVNNNNTILHFHVTTNRQFTFEIIHKLQVTG